MNTLRTSFAKGTIKTAGTVSWLVIEAHYEDSGNLEEVRPRLMARADIRSMFLTDYWKAYQPSRPATLVRRYMRLAVLKQGACHALRHVCAMHMPETGADIRLSRAPLGHAEPSTTQILRTW